MSKLLGKMTRKQHWVPQFYLRYFADSSGQLSVYNRKTGSFFSAKPENLCSKRDLYEVKYSNAGTWDVDRHYLQNFIEVELSEVESRLSSSCAKLLQCCEDRVFEGDDFQQGRMALCELAANLIVRHPDAMNVDREKARRSADVLQEAGALTERDLELLEWSDWREDYQALAELAISSTLLFSDSKDVPINRIREAFLEKQLSVLEAPMGLGFITASIPIAIFGPEDDSYDFDLAYMPLTNKYAALFSADALLKPWWRYFDGDRTLPAGCDHAGIDANAFISLASARALRLGVTSKPRPSLLDKHDMQLETAR